ncbi:MAG TPA: hypothetical protein DCO79_14730 [Spirochaeta sp.]|nr:hypothetical protein [Spirochaeta sp.]
MKKLYSVAEIAEILGLHQKTVQRFIREGKLKANKIGRAWKIHAELADKDPHTGVAEPSVSIEERLSVSAVIELKNAEDSETSRISNTLIAVLNGKDQSWGETRYDYIYQPETGTARFVLYGKPAFISSIMKMLEHLL